MSGTVEMTPIGHVESCYKEKFGIPRQPGLVPSARARLRLEGPAATREAVRGLEGCTHLWIIYHFHATTCSTWNTTVRPPRLGGNQTLGVFATRSNFRPNGIGLSVVRLDRIEFDGDTPVLHLSAHDILDKTPVLDIKPYISYSDSIPQALCPWIPGAPEPSFAVSFSAEAEAALAGMPADEGRLLRQLVSELLRLDPRPAYQGQAQPENRIYGSRLENRNVRWRYGEGNRVIVIEIAE